MTFLIIIIALYMFGIGYLGFRGWRDTKNTTDYLIAGGDTHPAVMALSYGATFISTSAIIGFGGAAAMFGMSLHWLTFFNIFIGVFVAFVFFGARTRTMGHHLQAHTFPELLGKRFQSRTLQVFGGLLIVVFMPIYTASVLIGAANVVVACFNINYDAALVLFSMSNMYNYIYSKNRWCAAVDLISDLVSDYSGNEDDEDDEDEEDIDEYSNNFCKDPCLKLTKVSFESCKYFIKEFYYCIRDFPYCHGGKIPI